VREIWAIRIRLQLANRLRDQALFNLTSNNKLRGCDLVELRVRDVAHGGTVSPKRPAHAEPSGAAHVGGLLAW
jgi:hypothetical protein